MRRFAIPFEHNVRWGGTYVIQPRHMGGFYKMLIKQVYV